MANSVLLSKTPGGSSSIWLSSKSLNGGTVSLINVERFKFEYSFPLAPHSPPPQPFKKKEELIYLQFLCRTGQVTWNGL